jgi:DNA-binding transcriptional ArsR family regulator
MSGIADLLGLPAEPAFRAQLRLNLIKSTLKLIPVEDALQAIANPRRRAILDLVWEQERPASEIAEAVGMSRPATSQHLRVLRDAELVSARIDGNRRLYRARAERLAALRAALDAFWAERLDGLAREAEIEQR